MGHALEGVASVKGVAASLAEAGRITLDLRTVHEASEVPSSGPIQGEFQECRHPQRSGSLLSLALVARQCLGTTSLVPQSLAYYKPVAGFWKLPPCLSSCDIDSWGRISGGTGHCVASECGEGRRFKLCVLSIFCFRYIFAF